MARTKKTQTPVEELFDGITFKDLLTPLAIIAGALIIGGSILALMPDRDFSHSYKKMYADKTDTQPTPSVPQDDNNLAAQVIPVSNLDHVRGNEDAAVMLIEYSDLDCPFCARVHDTLLTLVDEYDGDVAWAYRHFPIPSLHPNAPELALISECVGQAGGDQAFFGFIDAYFAGDIGAELSGLEAATGVAVTDIESCVEDGVYVDLIESHAENAKATGATGTPWTIAIGPNNTYAIIRGAQPIESWRAVIDELLQS